MAKNKKTVAATRKTTRNLKKVLDNNETRNEKTELKHNIPLKKCSVRVSQLSESTISKLQPKNIIESIELNANLQIRNNFLAPIHDGKVLRSETIPVEENNTFNIAISTVNKKLRFHHNNVKPKVLKKASIPKRLEVVRSQISIDTEWKNCCRADNTIEKGKILSN